MAIETITDNGLSGNRVAKAWADIDSLGDAINDSFNIASYTDNGTGDKTMTFTNDMANESYMALAQCGRDDTPPTSLIVTFVYARSVSDISFNILAKSNGSTSHSGTDYNHVALLILGDQ